MFEFYNPSIDNLKSDFDLLTEEENLNMGTLSDQQREYVQRAFDCAKDVNNVFTEETLERLIEIFGESEVLEAIGGEFKKENFTIRGLSYLHIEEAYSYIDEGIIFNFESTNFVDDNLNFIYKPFLFLFVDDHFEVDDTEETGCMVIDRRIPDGNLNDVVILFATYKGLYQAETPTYSFKHRYRNTTLIGTGAYKFRPYTVARPAVVYSISVTATNGTASADNPTTIEENKTATLTFTANDGYALPESVTVSGATSSWDSSTGTLVLSNPTGDVTITVECVLATPKLSTPANVSADGTTVSFDEVENAASYEIFADGTSIGYVQETPTPTLISFTIAGTTYQAEEGMTWAEWVESSYNTGGFYILDGRIKTYGLNFVATVNAPSTTYAVSTTDTIIRDAVYYLPTIDTPPSGGGTGN